METKAIYNWFHDYIVAKEDNRPVLQDVLLEGGYLYGLDGYAMARVPLRLIDRGEWLKVHQVKHGLYSTYGHFYTDRLPCGSEDATDKHERYGEYPNVQQIALRGWDNFGWVNTRNLLWDMQKAKAFNQDCVDFEGLPIAVFQLEKVFNASCFLMEKVELRVSVARIRADRFICLSTDKSGIELYIMPMYGKG